MFSKVLNRGDASTTDTDDVTRVSLAGLVRLRGAVRAVKRPTGRNVSAAVSGGSQSRALGRGLDFSEVREYHAGDDVRTIDWKVTARSGKPHTKIYNEERERPFLIAVDLRSTMFFATRVAFKSVVASRLSAMVAWAAASNRDRVGGLVFSDTGFREIKPAAGSKGVTKLLNEIVNAHQSARDLASTNPALDSEKPGLNDAFQHLGRSAHTGSSVCLITDFAGMDDTAGGALNQLLKHNHVAACRIFDPLEASLPSPARYSISDGIARAAVDTTSGEMRTQYAQAFSARVERTRQIFSGQGNSYWQCEVTEPLLPVANHIMRSLPGSV